MSTNIMWEGLSASHRPSL